MNGINYTPFIECGCIESMGIEKHGYFMSRFFSPTQSNKVHDSVVFRIHHLNKIR